MSILKNIRELPTAPSSLISIWKYFHVVGRLHVEIPYSVKLKEISEIRDGQTGFIQFILLTSFQHKSNTLAFLIMLYLIVVSLKIISMSRNTLESYI